MKKSHVFAALLALVFAAATIGQMPLGVQAGAVFPANVSAVNVLVFGLMPCVSGIRPDANVKIECGSTVWGNTVTGSGGEFIINLGVVGNDSTLLSSMLGNQCSVLVTATTWSSCNVSLPRAAIPTATDMANTDAMPVEIPVMEGMNAVVTLRDMGDAFSGGMQRAIMMLFAAGTWTPVAGPFPGI